MSALLILIILLVLLGGGGFYAGGPRVGGGLAGLILLIIIVMARTTLRLRERPLRANGVTLPDQAMKPRAMLLTHVIERAEVRGVQRGNRPHRAAPRSHTVRACYRRSEA
jgi:hypothetical protein